MQSALKVYDILRGKIGEEESKTLIEWVEESIESGAATKADIASLKEGMVTKADKADIAVLREGMSTKADKADIASLKEGMSTKADKADIAVLKEDIAVLKEGMVTKADKADIAVLREGMVTKADKIDIAVLKEGMATKADIAALKDEIWKLRLVLLGIAILIVATNPKVIEILGKLLGIIH